MRSRLTLLALIASISILAAACGGGTAAEETTEAASEAGEEVSEAASAAEEETSAAAGGGGGGSGSIAISGSSTVQPISTLVAELFNEDNPDVQVSVDGPGTGDGFELFCAGDIEIADASRAISEEEVAACEEAGIEFVELQVGVDGLSILTSPQNTAVTCLDTAALYALTGPESQGFANWSDAAALATELGSAYADALPDQPLTVVGPGEESGTYDTFVEFAITDIAETRPPGEDAVTRPDYQSSPNDNVIIDGVAGAPASLGWVGFAFAENAGDTVTEIEVAGEDGTCVAPTIETIGDGSYPFSRPLFIYVSVAAAEENQAVADFVDFYLAEDGQLSVEEAGYVLPPDDVVSDAASRWESRTPGTQAE